MVLLPALIPACSSAITFSAWGIFFYFDNSQNQGPSNALYKISAKYIKGSGEKVDFSGLVIFSNSGHF